MADVVGLTIIKKFTYRGDANEEFSNTYHLTGSVPSDAAAWRTLFDALVAEEKKLYGSDVSVVGGYGYNSDADNAHAVWSVDLHQAPVAGTLDITGGTKTPGDAAVWVRWKTSRMNTRGKAIYLRKYYHGAIGSQSGGVDAVLSTQKTALNAFGTKLRDGTFTDGRLIRSQHQAETILSSDASSYVTTRTLKRRGKRPS